MGLKDGQAGASDSEGNVVDFPHGALAREGISALERINQFDFYRLAGQLAAVNRSGDQPAEDVIFDVLNARDAMGKLLDGDPIELGVSSAKAVELHRYLQAIVDRHYTRPNERGEPTISYPETGAVIKDYEWNWLRRAIADLEMILAEEMREAATYRVPTRGIYNTAKLADAAHCTFPAELEGFIPEKTKLEWRAAGRCLAFGMFTACGFHVARAVEGTLEAYFHHFNGGPDTKLKQWGQYLDALEKIGAKATAPMPDPKTMGELKQLKDDWRNPLMHPRVVLAEPDARAVFNNGETLVMMMAQELAKAAEADVQPTLSLIQGDGAA